MRVYRIIATAVAVGVIAVPSASAAAETTIVKSTTTPVTQIQKKPTKKDPRLPKQALVIALTQKAVWRCQDDLGKKRTRPSVSPWGLPASVPYRLWVQAKWKAQKTSCERELSRRAVPLTNDWQTAVRLVQRIYPGTSNWLLTISRREGGHGGFVMNNQGSGCGGWMQYMSSTYYAYSPDAFADAKRKGFILPPDTNSWYHPMGQAITAGYMRYTGRDGNHWSQTNSGF